MDVRPIRPEANDPSPGFVALLTGIVVGFVSGVTFVVIAVLLFWR